MNSFLHGLDPQMTAGFLKLITRRSYDPGSLVADFDDISTDVFFIESGAVRVTVRNVGGREIILGDLSAGEIVGDMAAIDNLPRSANITALHRATIARMPGQAFVEMLAAVPEAAARMLRILSARIRLGNQRLLEMATLGLKHRLYAELLREARQRPGPVGGLAISPPPPQHVLAARIGGRREAVSREIAALLRLGILERTPKALILRKPEWLEREVTRELES
jgi:CRP/FNR family transcriptional regulator, cyclic AMP receptor protein